MDPSDYDMVEDIRNSEDASNASNDDAEGNGENVIIQNPYYDGGDNMSQGCVDDGRTTNVIENPYYGDVDNESNEGDNDRINVVENPYYGGIDNLSDSDDDHQEEVILNPQDDRH